jgi:hypothetical protein
MAIWDLCQANWLAAVHRNGPMNPLGTASLPRHFWLSGLVSSAKIHSKMLVVSFLFKRQIL